MAAAVVKSRSQPAEAHVEWWSAQQALTLILSGDQAAADAAAGQTFADFVEEMKRRGLAAWIGEAISELYAAIRGAPLIECGGYRIHGQEAQCALRGQRLRENEIRNIAADEIHDHDRSAAWRLVLRGNEIVLGANDHIEWRSLEFERSGVLRAARWARRDGWLERRVADIDELVVKDELSMLSCVHMLMMKMRQDGGRLAAIIDEDFPQADLVPTRMQKPRWNKRPPLWLMRQEPETAEETWAAAHEIFDQARSLLLKALKYGNVEAFAKDEDRGQIVSAQQFQCRRVFVFSSIVGDFTNVRIGKMDVDRIKVSSPQLKMASTSARLLRLRKQLADLLRQAGSSADDHTKSYWASKVDLEPGSREFRSIWRLAREDAGLPPRPASGPKCKMATAI